MEQAMAMIFTQKLNKYAQKMNGGKLLAKWSSEDAVAQELQYYPA